MCDGCVIFFGGELTDKGKLANVQRKQDFSHTEDRCAKHSIIFWDPCVEIGGLPQQRNLKHDPNTVELMSGC